MTKKLPTLPELRQQIDAIDDQLHSLLRQRAEVVHVVRQVKGKQAIFIRPGREASMMRDLLQRPAGRIPPGLIMRLWREMIGSFTMQEGRLSVAVTVGKGEADLWDITRDFYGSFTPLVACGTAAQALAQVGVGKVEIAALPLPEEKQANPWWARLVRQPDLQVFAQHPFDLADAGRANWRGNRRGAWSVARLAPEPTGQDHGLLLVWGGKGAGIRALLLELLQPLAIHQNAAQTVWLVTCDGLIDPQSRKMKALAARLAAAGVQWRVAGGYAVPISGKKLKK